MVHANRFEVAMFRIKRIVCDFFGSGYLSHGIHFLVVEYEEPSRLYLTISIGDETGKTQTVNISGLDQILQFNAYFKKLKRLENFTFAANGIEDGRKRPFVIVGTQKGGSFTFHHMDMVIAQIIKIQKLDYEIFRSAALRIEKEISLSLMTNEQDL